MDEYIEREAMKRALRNAHLHLDEAGIVIEIDDIPAADVQPVVRCKDCKHFHLDYFGEVNGASIIVAHEICDLWAGGCRTTQDTFCSNGVRKDAED